MTFLVGNPCRPSAPYGALLIILLVTFMLPLDKGVALRNAVILLGVCWCVWQRRTIAAALRGDRLVQGLLAGFAGFVVFLLVHAAVFADSFPVSAAAALKEWGGAGAILAFGICVALVAGQMGHAASGLCAAIVALLAHTVWMLLYQASPLLAGQAFALGKTPFAAYDYHSQIVSQLVIVLLVAVTIRVWSDKKLLPWSDRWLTIATFVALLGMIGVNARTGLVHVGAAVLFLFGVLVFGARSSLGKVQKWLVVGLLGVILLIVSLSSVLDGRWPLFAESAVAGIDIEHNRTWINETKYPLPILKNGKQADHSAYLRTAFATVAIRSISNHPAGVGYSVDAFGRAVQKDYGTGSNIISSHSSILDFIIGAGVAGGTLLTILVIFGCSLLVRRYIERGEAAALLAAVLIGSYFVRCFPEGHLSGWRLKLALFLCGLALGANLLRGQHSASQT